MRTLILAGCLLLVLVSLVHAQTVQVPCNYLDSDCSYQGDGIGVEYICTNGGNCFCNNAEVCYCQGNAGDCNCGYSSTCFCAGNDGDCCYTGSTVLAANSNYGDDWVTSNGVCYGDSSDSDGPAKTTLIVVGTCLGVLLILLVIAAVVRRRRYYASLESNVVYAPVPSYGVAPAPAQYNPYQVPQSGYTPGLYNQSAPSTASQPYNYYPTSNGYAYTATSNTR